MVKVVKMEQKLYLFIDKYKDLLLQNNKLAIAVSGGIDSMALMLISNNWCKNNNIKTRAIKFTKINEKNISAKTYIQCKCECGNYFETALYEFVCYGKIKCNECNRKTSKWCIKVEDFLKENNLTFTKEVNFKDCRDKHPLPFDYKLDINNGLIEVDGEQHFYDNGYAIRMDDKKRIENFKIRKKHDNIKEEYCKKNNIKFLRISYKEVLNNSYKDKILSFIT